MGEKVTLKLGALKGGFELIDPTAMNKIIGGRNLNIRIGGNSCGGILPS